jgi:alkanesulfonate monooxygenase SsuD/methylene tetrahydromethanopterin reductase-like flavin-dependent oxidoreductase (luciferase family)
MRTAVNLPPFTDPASLVAMAVEAEQAGWDGVFLWDHMVLSPAMRLDVHDPWVLLGAMAARTERVRLGTLVTPLARRRPWVVARHVITLDHLSGGRAVLGVGLGEPGDADFAAFGDPGGRTDRAEVLDEALPLLDGLWRGPVEHRGRHFTVETDLLPRPVQRPRPPVWVAAVAPHRRSLARAQRWDGVAPLGPDAGPITPEQLDGYLAVWTGRRAGTSSPPGRRACPSPSTRTRGPPGWSTARGRWATGSTTCAAASAPGPDRSPAGAGPQSGRWSPVTPSMSSRTMSTWPA